MNSCFDKSMEHSAALKNLAGSSQHDHVMLPQCPQMKACHFKDYHEDGFTKQHGIVVTNVQ